MPYITQPTGVKRSFGLKNVLFKVVSMISALFGFFPQDFPHLLGKGVT